MEFRKQDIEETRGSVFLYESLRKINSHRIKNNREPIPIINNCPSYHTADNCMDRIFTNRRKGNYYNLDDLPCSKFVKEIKEYNSSTGETIIIETDEFITIKNSDSIRVRNKINKSMENYFIDFYKIGN